MPRKKKDKEYYGPKEEAAVVAFLNATTHSEKEKIYREQLSEPINKMIESIIRTYKLYRQSYDFNDLHADTLSFLITKFDKFKPERGNKSFSYFGTVCKNYLYNEMMKEYKKNTVFIPIEENESDYLNRDDLSYRIEEEDIDLVGFIGDFCDNISNTLIEEDLSENEYKIGYSLLAILNDWEELFPDNTGGKNSSKFNKNLILLYIRNMTGLTTKEIRNGMKRFKLLYSVFKNKYL